tara:strand:- start:14072 stop:14293 length:222 start_codon:yes stop_codon:yes gene_type:complete
MRSILDGLLLSIGHAFTALQVGGPAFACALPFFPLPIAVCAGVVAGGLWASYVAKKVDEGVPEPRERSRMDQE